MKWKVFIKALFLASIAKFDNQFIFGLFVFATKEIATVDEHVIWKCILTQQLW